MQVIEQRQLISRKNLVGCDIVIYRKPSCAKIEVIQRNNLYLEEEASFLLFVYSKVVARAKPRLSMKFFQSIFKKHLKVFTISDRME